MSSRTNAPKVSTAQASVDVDKVPSKAVGKPSGGGSGIISRPSHQCAAISTGFLLATTSVFLGWTAFLVCVVLFVFAVLGLLSLLFYHSSRKEKKSDFEVAIDLMAIKVRNRNGDTDCQTGPWESSTYANAEITTPLIPIPDSKIYQIEDRQFGIIHKKSGEVLLEGSTNNTMMRLLFSMKDEENGFASIQGSRVLVEPSTSQSQSNKTKSFVVQKGLVCMATKMAYFVENNNDTQRVVFGKFDSPEYASFSGEWLASDGSRGSLSLAHALLVDYAVPLDEVGSTTGAPQSISVNDALC